MKKITAYVKTVRIHWLVEKLQSIGIKEIMVTEYFKPSSQISRFELYCEDQKLETVRKIIHQVGTSGTPADHFIEVEDFNPNAPSKFPMGKRISLLEE